MASDPILKTHGNPGLKRGFELTRNSKTIDMIGPMNCDIFQKNRLLSSIVDLKIKITRSKLEFCLTAKKYITKPFHDYQNILERASVFMRKVKVSAGVLL